jgi:sugar/nucleoside kinase (ribokinase family)
MGFNYDVIVVGDYSIDLIFTGMPGLPELGKDTLASDFDMIPGEAYTTAVVLHRLGIKVGWAANFGNDIFSQTAINRSAMEGLDQSLFIIHKKPYRRLSAAASFDQDRAFMSYYDPEPDAPAAMKAIAMASAKILFVPGLYYGSLFDIAINLIKIKGMKIVMDGNTAETDVSMNYPKIKKVLKSLDVFIPNAREVKLLTGQENLEKGISELAKLCKTLVVKDGAAGSYGCVDGKIIHQPGIVVKPVDTTGAGDCFDAGFLRAWLTGLPLQVCLQWGNICGALSTLGRGGTGFFIGEKEVQSYL